ALPRRRPGHQPARRRGRRTTPPRVAARPLHLPGSPVGRGGDPMTRVAAIDCGTNSIRLLIADVPRRGPLVEVARHMEVVRLGQGVDRTGMLDPAALERTLDAARRYAEICREHDVETTRFVATSA